MPYPVRAALFPHRMPKPSSFSLCLQNRGRSLGESQLLLEKKLMNNVGKGSSYCFQAGIDCLFLVLERLQNRTYLFRACALIKYPSCLFFKSLQRRPKEALETYIMEERSPRSGI